MRVALLALALAGCAHAEPVPPVFGAGQCDATAAMRLVGRTRSPTLAAEARKLSRSRVARVIAPGLVVTQDYRTDRVNLSIDAVGKVVAVRCG